MTDEELIHYGTPRKSGRYPWGSGGDPNQRNKQFLSYVDDLKKKGMSETDIAKGLGMTTTQLRAQKTIAKNAQKKADISQAQRLKDKGMSNIAIGQQMGINESSVRALLAPSAQQKNDQLTTISSMLKDEVEKKKYLDVGVGTENHLGISQTSLNTALAMLKEEGYRVDTFKSQQLGTGKDTKYKVLSAPGTEYRDIVTNKDKIRTVAQYSEDGGRSFVGIQTPRSVSSKRIAVRYANEGGADMDGVIELRRGVEDISLGKARYAQVRIAVDGTHYLKGMAMYTDDLPKGIDMRFNTNKSDTGIKADAFKPLKNDPENPFGSIIRQKHYIDKNGEKQLSALNIVNEEGEWAKWSSKLSSQMLSKQTPSLAKQQLGLSYDLKRAEFDEIMSLTNPTVKKELLKAFADGADSSAVKLKAAGLPRTASHVILPINSLKDNEIYAPNYRDGETVVLIRHPHGGKFEIPELVVNNRNPQAKAVIKQAQDAVGINSRVASRLSGADFDGDTVLVIPNNGGKNKPVQISAPLAGLKDFDPQKAYPAYDGMKKMSPRTKQLQMGDVSNLITDMTLKGANQSELARAVRHSMVVIDAEKHTLNYKQSAIDNGIKELKAKYQGGPRAGASTLISQARSEVALPERKPRSAAKGGPIDPQTGKLVYENTNRSYTNKNGETKFKLTKVAKLAATDNAYTLSSGTPMEAVYADHANRLKALANEARKELLKTPGIPYSPSAKVAYSNEVKSLTSKLNVALKNAPLERQAQLVAGTIVSAKLKANPTMEKAELKKEKGRALTEARLRVGASKQKIDITPKEWEAIQSGAISENMLKKILTNSDLDQIKELAMPRTKSAMVPAKVARAKQMLKAGYSQADIASALGVSTSAINSIIENGG